MIEADTVIAIMVASANNWILSNDDLSAREGSTILSSCSNAHRSTTTHQNAFSLLFICIVTWSSALLYRHRSTNDNGRHDEQKQMKIANNYLPDSGAMGVLSVYHSPEPDLLDAKHMGMVHI